MPVPDRQPAWVAVADRGVQRGGAGAALDRACSPRPMAPGASNLQTAAPSRSSSAADVARERCAAAARSSAVVRGSSVEASAGPVAVRPRRRGSALRWCEPGSSKLTCSAAGSRNGHRRRRLVVATAPPSASAARREGAWRESAGERPAHFAGIGSPGGVRALAYLPTRCPQPNRSAPLISRAVTHLRPVPDPKPPAALDERAGRPAERSPSSSAGRRCCALECVRMLAVAKSGHLDSSLSSADMVAALYYRVLRHDPRRPRLARARPLRPLQGPRGSDPVRGARPARLLPARGPDGAAPDRRPAPGPPGHEPHPRRRGLDRLARPGALDVPRDRARAAPRRPRRHRPRLRRALRRRLPGGPDLGGGHGGPALRRQQRHRDRRLQPPADRRHDRGGHGHRRRPRQVRGLRLGRGRDRRPRHGRRRRGARAQPHARQARRDRLPDDQGQGRLDDGGPLRLPRQGRGQPRVRRRGARGARARASRSRPAALQAGARDEE